MNNKFQKKGLKFKIKLMIIAFNIGLLSYASLNTFSVFASNLDQPSFKEDESNISNQNIPNQNNLNQSNFTQGNPNQSSLNQSDFNPNYFDQSNINQNYINRSITNPFENNINRNINREEEEFSTIINRSNKSYIETPNPNQINLNRYKNFTTFKGNQTPNNMPSSNLFPNSNEMYNYTTSNFNMRNPQNRDNMMNYNQNDLLQINDTDFETSLNDDNLNLFKINNNKKFDKGAKYNLNTNFSTFGNPNFPNATDIDRKVIQNFSVNKKLLKDIKPSQRAKYAEIIKMSNQNPNINPVDLPKKQRYERYLHNFEYAKQYENYLNQIFLMKIVQKLGIAPYILCTKAMLDNIIHIQYITSQSDMIDNELSKITPEETKLRKAEAVLGTFYIRLLNKYKDIKPEILQKNEYEQLEMLSQAFGPDSEGIPGTNIKGEQITIASKDLMNDLLQQAFNDVLGIFETDFTEEVKNLIGNFETIQQWYILHKKVTDRLRELTDNRNRLEEKADAFKNDLQKLFQRVDVLRNKDEFGGEKEAARLVYVLSLESGEFKTNFIAPLENFNFEEARKIYSFDGLDEFLFTQEEIEKIQQNFGGEGEVPLELAGAHISRILTQQRKTKKAVFDTLVNNNYYLVNPIKSGQNKDLTLVIPDNIQMNGLNLNLNQGNFPVINKIDRRKNVYLDDLEYIKEYKKDEMDYKQIKKDYEQKTFEKRFWESRYKTELDSKAGKITEELKQYKKERSTFNDMLQKTCGKKLVKSKYFDPNIPLWKFLLINEEGSLEKDIQENMTKISEIEGRITDLTEQTDYLEDLKKNDELDENGKVEAFNAQFGTELSAEEIENLGNELQGLEETKTQLINNSADIYKKLKDKLTSNNATLQNEIEKIKQRNEQLKIQNYDEMTNLNQGIDEFTEINENLRTIYDRGENSQQGNASEQTKITKEKINSQISEYVLDIIKSSICPQYEELQREDPKLANALFDSVRNFIGNPSVTTAEIKDFIKNWRNRFNYNQYNINIQQNSLIKNKRKEMKQIEESIKQANTELKVLKQKYAIAVSRYSGNLSNKLINHEIFERKIAQKKAISSYVEKLYLDLAQKIYDVKQQKNEDKKSTKSKPPEPKKEIQEKNISSTITENNPPSESNFDLTETLNELVDSTKKQIAEEFKEKTEENNKHYNEIKKRFEEEKDKDIKEIEKNIEEIDKYTNICLKLKKKYEQASKQLNTEIEEKIKTKKQKNEEKLAQLDKQMKNTFVGNLNKRTLYPNTQAIYNTMNNNIVGNDIMDIEDDYLDTNDRRFNNRPNRDSMNVESFEEFIQGLKDNQKNNKFNKNEKSIRSIPAENYSNIEMSSILDDIKL